jgi:hypothetical protein
MDAGTIFLAGKLFTTIPISRDLVPGVIVEQYLANLITNIRGPLIKQHLANLITNILGSLDGLHLARYGHAVQRFINI